VKPIGKSSSGGGDLRGEERADENEILELSCLVKVVRSGLVASFSYPHETKLSCRPHENEISQQRGVKMENALKSFFKGKQRGVIFCSKNEEKHELPRMVSRM
jgi:hypothetical protein